jgi:hypothetical protein
VKSIHYLIVVTMLAVSACASAAEDQSVFTTPLKPIKPSSNRYLVRFMSADFHLVYRTKDIDPGVFKLVRRALGSDPRIAEPNERVRFSDVMEPGNPPHRRLVLAGGRGDLWFVVFFEGGYAPPIISSFSCHVTPDRGDSCLRATYLTASINAGGHSPRD